MGCLRLGEKLSSKVVRVASLRSPPGQDPPQRFLDALDLNLSRPGRAAELHQ
jgi:hypothetical protein